MSDLAQFLPWQASLAASWLSQRERFAHAWLIHGLPGIGKRQFALAAAASLLCESPLQGLACGHCAACLWLASGNHPDLRRIRPEAVALEEGAAAGGAEDDGEAAASAAKKAPSKDIRVEQLRVLSPWFNTATHRGGWRVAVLYPAQAMNSISANALLKVLEEPPEHTVFLLVADAPDRLLPTLVSRCRRLPLPVPGKPESLAWLEAQGVAEAGQWLAAAGGAPLLAMQLAQTGASPCPEWLNQLVAPLARAQAPDIGQLADHLEKMPADVWIDALQRLFLDLLLAASGAPVRYFPSLEKQTRLAARHAAMASLADTAKWLAQQRAVAGHPLNAKLLVHSTLQRVAMACRPAS
ncbi:DNA polymerase III subunit delta' [Pollutimonas bauzanensis]|uniref:DNA polymerase III, delta prime subunit n=1 Tax=Pollutimonas bauzanensis TaxID=658167 RepID=A0A1M5WHB4_9BURK|nr:DNA polymerase III subunit delta' [Pollutimonas bauzanensis]SHH86847.1 DNA polymerase III, delta prime subunit [Pollutimonas bauzanensis]